jgi:multidrug efflux pump subunit AcrB
MIAFTPFGLSNSNSGQIMKAMFWVLTYSLFLSWILAVSVTPFLVDLLMRDPDKDTGEGADPYKGLAYTLYRRVLDLALGHRKSVIVIMLSLLLVSLYGMGHVKKAFFTASNTPIFYMDIWLPYGTDIRATLDTVEKVETWVRQQDTVEFVSSTVGRGAPRFFMTYMPEQSYENFGQVQVRAASLEAMHLVMASLDQQMYRQFPGVLHQMRQMVFGPPTRSEIQARFRGSDPEVLRRLGKQAAEVIRSDPGSRSVFLNWQERSKELVPVVNESEARRLGISNEEIATNLKIAFGGMPVGVYRDGTRKLPIVVRLPEEERVDFDRIDNLRIWSPTLQTYVPIQQVVTRVDIRWTDALIQRKDRQRTLIVMSSFDKFSGQTAEQLFERIRPGVEAIPLPPGYSLDWGGEYENSQRSLKGAFGGLPLALAVMFALTVLLFNSVQRSLVIWLTVPLSLIGVSIGLLTMDLPLTFPAILGMLALTGMILKNGIVLIDQVMVELDAGKDTYNAVRDSAISRMRPVSMAAATTVLGMTPLVMDPFFASLAVTFIFGLTFATLLTLVFVPVLYVTIHRVPVPSPGAGSVVTVAD